MKCLNCGKETIIGKYCTNCGTKLPDVKKICSKCNTFNKSESLYCSECGASLEGAKELLVVTDKKENTDDGLLVYRVLSIVSICLNILSIFSVIINAVCFVFGIVSLTEANSISLKKDVNTKAIKICSIIGIVISTTIFVFKIFILVEIIISIINGIVDTTPPDHSYFF